MKKLKLNIQHLDGVEVLTREQLKKVMGGGFGSASCSGACPCADNCFCLTTVSDTKVCVVASA